MRSRAFRLVLALGLLQLALVGAWRLLTAAREAPEPSDGEPLRGEPSLAAFELTAPDGRRRRLDALAERGALLHFWATWCAPCVTELPALRAFAAEQRVPLVLVSDEPRELHAAFFGGAPPPEAFLDEGGALFGAARPSIRPESWWLGPGARPVRRFAGTRDWSRPEAVAPVLRLRERTADR